MPHFDRVGGWGSARREVDVARRAADALGARRKQRAIADEHQPRSKRARQVTRGEHREKLGADARRLAAGHCENRLRRHL